MIEARELRKVYKTKGGVVVNALDGVSVKLPDTGMIFILGKSGSGKSTLLNVLGGLDSFDSGEIIIKGTSAKDFKQSHYDSYRNTYIGFIFQEYNILEELTVGANVALAIELQGRKATDEEINDILKQVDLDGYGARKPNELSGGQKQRVAIARALVKKPEIIMADEPTGALDSTTGKQVFDTLKKLSRDKLVMIVSHDREFSEQYADRIIELKDGKIISDVEKEAHAEDYLDESAETDDSIVYGDGEINLKPGYTLTEEDRVAINEYLTAYAKGAVIKVGSKLKKKFSAKDFKPTDETKIKSNKKGDFKLIKSKLSIKNAFKLGAGGLNHKKVRLVFTILLSLVSFTLFGLADTIAAYDNIGTATSSIYDTGVDYASYVKMIKRTSGSHSYWRTDNTYLTPDDIEVIKAQTGKNVIGVYKKDAELSYKNNIGENTVDGMNPEALYTNYFSGLTAIDQNLIDEHGFTLVGRLPEARKNEIVITKYAYDYFNKVGYVTYTNEGKQEFDITQENDLIGKTISIDLQYMNDSSDYTIVGIIDTKFDYSRYEKLASSDAEFTVSLIESMALNSELKSAQSYSFACIGFVNAQMLTDILSAKEGSDERIESGNLVLYTVVDDSITEQHEIYGQEGENVTASMWVYALNSLENVKNNVIWVNSPLETLADNQIIVTTAFLQNMMSSGDMPDAWYDTSKLIGFEKIMFENCQNGEWPMMYWPYLDNILSYPKYFAAFSYAYNNLEAAKNAIAAVYNWDEETKQNELQNSNNVYTRFAEMADNGHYDEINNIVTDDVVNGYVNGVIDRYDLSDKKMSEDLKDKIIKTFTYNGKEYSSYDRNNLILNVNFINNINRIAGRKYAAENFGDALNYYKLIYNLDDSSIETVNVDLVLSTYGDYIAYGAKAPEGFVPSQTVDFQSYKASVLMDFFKTMPSTDKMILSCDAYLTGKYQMVKGIEIVGIVSEINHNGDVLIVSDNIINMMLGPNRGGIYTYAVGVMPTDRAGIKNIVKFSKNYINDAGDVMYQLSNNVMSQLGMVDEILDVLGQVFLYVGIGFAVFAALMLMNFISTSITHKKQDIGILRAIGSRSADVFRIFFAESFIIAMINYVLALTGTVTATIVINNLLRDEAGLLITFLNFGIRQIGILFAVSLAVAFVATVMPVYKIASMKPIDAIKNRK